LVKCEDLPKQVYSNKEYRFAIACPSGFWWETFRNQPPEWLFGSRVVEDRYKDRYPAGQVEMHVFPYDSDTLRHWIDTRIGTPFSGDSRHHWDSVSNVQESSVAGSTGIAFDYVFAGPESPTNFHAVAFVLQSKYVFVIDWWAYAASGYDAPIAKVANSMVTSLTSS
jgi:hypothetical protein